MARSGGRYTADKPDAKPKLAERTKDHPDGNRPRDAEGRPLDRPAPAGKPAQKAAKE